MARGKRKSVSRVLSLVIGGCIAVYSLIMFFLIIRNIDVGICDFFKEQISGLSEFAVDSMKKNQKDVSYIGTLASSLLEKAYAEQKSLDSEFVDEVCRVCGKGFSYESIAIYDTKGNQISSPAYGSDSNNPYIKSALSGTPYSSFYKPGSEVYVLHVAPVRNGKNIIAAVSVRAKAIDPNGVDYVSKVTGCDFTVFDNDTRLYTSIPGMGGTQIANPKLLKDAEAGNETILNTKIGGIKYLAHYFPLKDSSGKFVTSLYLGRPVSVVDHITKLVLEHAAIGALLLASVFVGVVIWILYRIVIRPLNGVNRALSDLSSGDADLTKRIEVKGNDEFADISISINKFLELLQGIIFDINSAQNKLSFIGEDLGTNSQDSASATAEIMANIAGVRKQSENQASAVANTTEVLERSAASVEALSQLVRVQTEGISDSSVAIEEMLGNISSVTNSVHKMSDSFRELGVTIDEGKSKLSNVDGKVNEIAEQSKMLIQANSIISQIASETNLLAMNAAIEAAHAGKAGEGFSVVANEIRKLAETSSQQSKNINAELKLISSSIKDVVSLSKDSQVAFGQIVERLDSTDTIIREIDNAMGEQENASRQIFSSLGSIKRQANEVSEKSSEVSNGIAAVAEDMESVNQISSSIFGSMDEMTAGAQEISNASQGVSDLAAQTKDNIDVISKKLKLFKIQN